MAVFLAQFYGVPAPGTHMIDAPG